MRFVATSIVVLLHTLQGTISETELGRVGLLSSFDLGRVMSSGMGTEPYAAMSANMDPDRTALSSMPCTSW
jgi:hypothetical protein